MPENVPISLVCDCVLVIIWYGQTCSLRNNRAAERSKRRVLQESAGYGLQEKCIPISISSLSSSFGQNNDMHVHSSKVAHESTIEPEGQTIQKSNYGSLTHKAENLENAGIHYNHAVQRGKGTSTGMYGIQGSPLGSHNNAKANSPAQHFTMLA